MKKRSKLFERKKNHIKKILASLQIHYVYKSVNSGLSCQFTGAAIPTFEYEWTFQVDGDQVGEEKDIIYHLCYRDIGQDGTIYEKTDVGLHEKIDLAGVSGGFEHEVRSHSIPLLIYN